MLAAKRAICINCALHFVLHANKMHYGICNYVRVPLIKIVIVEKSCENGKLQVFLAAARLPPANATLTIQRPIYFCATKCS